MEPKKRVLVDTSCFIDYLRDGKNEIVPRLALLDEIYLSHIVRLELLKGARRNERQVLRNFLEGLFSWKDLPDPHSIENALLILHGRGINLGLADSIILADALRTNSAIASSDKELLRGAKALKISIVS
jgi:predicted nucleic acid-binding protein